MAYAVQECYSSIEKIMHSLVDGEGKLWWGIFIISRRIIFWVFLFLQKVQLMISWCYPIVCSCLSEYRVERVFREINGSISEGSLVITLSLKKLPVVLSRFTALTGLLVFSFPWSIVYIYWYKLANDLSSSGDLRSLFNMCSSELPDILFTS